MTEYKNSRTQSLFKPHSQKEADFLRDDEFHWCSIYGGDGVGKTSLAVIKCLERLRAGMSGVILAADFPRLRHSLWPLFSQWCTPDLLVERERHRVRPDWSPACAFETHFPFGDSVSTLYVGTADSPDLWGGVNLNFAFVDEPPAEYEDLLKVLNRRLRVTGPGGERPQGFITRHAPWTNNRMHFLKHAHLPGQMNMRDLKSREELMALGLVGVFSKDCPHCFYDHENDCTLYCQMHRTSLESQPGTGFLLVGTDGKGEVVLNHPDLERDAQGVAHLTFSPDQARNLGQLLINKAAEADRELMLEKGSSSDCENKTGG